jgi:endonuclease III related protein
MRTVVTAREKPTIGRRRRNDSIADIRQVYRKLLRAHGPQDWWPGDSKFEIMVGALLTQNTAWTNVEKAIANLKRANALSPQALLDAPPRRLAGWLRPSGYFNVKARRLKALCRWLVEQGGIRKLSAMSTSQLRDALLAVHGIGPETADDILLYAFDRPVFVIDAYTRRIFGRLGVADGAEDYEVLRNMFETRLGPDISVFNEYHALIVAHGKDVCRPKPRCERCCLASACRLTESVE